MKEIILYILSSSSIVYLFVQWVMKKQDAKTAKNDKVESDVISMLKFENIELQKELLIVKKEMVEIRTELHQAEIKVQKYEQGMNIVLGVIQNLKSIRADEKIVIDAIVKNLQPS